MASKAEIEAAAQAACEENYRQCNLGWQRYPDYARWANLPPDDQERWRNNMRVAFEVADRVLGLLRGVDAVLNDAGYVKQTEEAQVP